MIFVTNDNAIRLHICVDPLNPAECDFCTRRAFGVTISRRREIHNGWISDGWGECLNMPEIEVQGRAVSCAGLLFDKDGTLLHFMDMWGEWAETLTDLVDGHLTVIGAKRLGPKESLLGLKYNEAGQAIDYDKTGPLAMGTVEEVTALLAWQLYAAGVPWNEALLQIRQLSASAMLELRKHRPAHSMPGLHQLLHACKEAGIPLGVVTSDTTEDAIEHLEWMGIRSCFQSIVGRDRVSLGKPDPEMVFLACRELGIPHESVVVIGDSNADMQMGRHAGVPLTIGITEEDNAATYLLDADLIIRSYEEIRVIK